MNMSDRKPYRFNRRKDKNNTFYVMFHHIPGRWFSTGTKNFAEAVLWADRRLREDNQESPFRKEDMTLREFAGDFYKPSDPRGFKKRNEKRGFHYSDTYYEQKQRHLENYILPAHGDYLLSAINDLMIENFIYDTTSVYLKRDLSNDTKNKIYTAYNFVMEEARREGFVSENPCDKVQKLAKRSKRRESFTSSELRILFPDDRGELLRIWGNLMWACYFLIQYETGWRPGEAAALNENGIRPKGIYTDSDIDWKKRTVQRRIKTSDCGQTFKVGDLSTRTLELLKELLLQTNGKYPFMQNNGKFIGSAGANKHLEASCKRAGIDIVRNGKKRTQYSFRHSYQTYTLGLMPENERLLRMGHTKIRPEYTHMDPDELLDRIAMAGNIDDFIKKMG